MTYLVELIHNNTVKTSYVVVAKSPADAVSVAAISNREFMVFLGLPVERTSRGNSVNYHRVFLPNKLEPHVGIFLYNP